MTPEENERLTHIEGNAPMGQLVRRYWIPFMLSTDLPGPDCDPMRVRLFGEDLVAFRDSSGKVGLVAKGCPHRRADLFYGRNEEDGLRCIYHGWKFDVAGRCVEAPTEPREANFAAKIRLRSYPVEEVGGTLWTYMGPAELQPELPDFEWMHVPESHRFISWSTQECNYAQAIEGGIDTVHSIYLHSTLDSHRRLDDWKRSGQGGQGGTEARLRNRENPPILFTENTDYGVLVGGRYQARDNKAEDYWRYNIFLLPFYSMAPGAPDRKFSHAFVPLDDVTTARWSFTWNLEKPLAARDVAAMRLGTGIHAELVPGTHKPVRTRANDYLIDRDEQRTLMFTGIKGIGEQDFAVQEGMGPICDREAEHLGVTDVGIIQMRRRLLQQASELEQGLEPYAASHGEVYRIHAGDALLPAEITNWADDQKTKQALAAKW